ncbi:MAG TPA: phosphoribosylanthranilate isomerase, partial [Thermoleophilia bacterium]|nr:phosphoribosylanthranilate isomerase [Thermoleophilia bacterium]
AEVALEAELDGIQLHGATPLREIRELRGRLTDVVLIKAVGVEPEYVAPPQGPGQAAPELPAGEAARLAEKGAELKGLVDLILLDTRVAGRSGGTGVTFPWPLAHGLEPEPPYLVAGGIGPQNLCRALTESGAAGADVSSGVESAPGIKDHDMLRELVDAWRNCPSPDGGAVSAEIVRGKGRA